MIERLPFGTTSAGATATRYVLKAGRVRAAVSDFGATLLSLEVPARDGMLADVLLGFDSVEGYAGDNPAFFGGTVGPVANRTDRAEVPIGGVTYHLPKNDGPEARNNNHTSSEHGLHKRLWDAEVDDDTNAVRLSCRLADGELGLPGNRTFHATYALGEKDGSVELRVTYRCESDAPTYVNITNHSYFNLAGNGSGDVLGQVVQVDAERFLPVREDSVPTGEIVDVAGTPFDFREPKALGRDIDADDEQLRRGRGYDHCLCVRGYVPGGLPRRALVARDPASGREIEVLLTTPAAHLYTGNWLGDKGAKGGFDYAPRSGFAFESEFYPDAIHHPDWPQPVCDPDHPWESTIVYLVKWDRH